MALILVNAGQCGNQLGFDLLSALHQNTQGRPEEQEAFFRSGAARGAKPVARAVCLDTEPKAVLSCLQRSARKEWAYDPSSCAYRHGGAGNNWAMGYQMCSGNFLEISLDCIRRELEHCDLPPSLLISHSIGGGTGSGLGTKITEALSDEMPDVTRLNAAVMPYHFGEVIVQHYNSVLCLAKVAQHSDGVLLFDNDVAHDMCRTGFGKERPALKDLNMAISMGLISALLPKNRPGGGGRHSSVPMQVAHLFAHPGYRFADVKFVPQTSERSVEYTYDSWKALLSRLQAMQRAGTTSELRVRPASARTPAEDCAGETPLDEFRTLAGILTLRGTDAGTATAGLSVSNVVPSVAPAPSSSASVATPPPPSAASSRYRQGTRSSVARDSTSFDRQQSSDAVFDLATARWGEADALTVHYSNHHVNGYQRSASVLSNGQSVLPYLKRPALRAAKMFSSGAYVHQYTNLGIERDEFVDAFMDIGQIIQNYQSL